MFISVLDLFKLGIGPSSSHTLGPMTAASRFIKQVQTSEIAHAATNPVRVRCTLRGSLAYTGKGHATDKAVVLGLNQYTPDNLTGKHIASLITPLWESKILTLSRGMSCAFEPCKDIFFDTDTPSPEHPNGMLFELVDSASNVLMSEAYFSIGGGFIATSDELTSIEAPLLMAPSTPCSYAFDSAKKMLDMATKHKMSIAQMKRANELNYRTKSDLDDGLDAIWRAMQSCINSGLNAEGLLPGSIKIPRRAKHLYEGLSVKPRMGSLNDWMCAYAMAVNEENAAGHMVVTAPTNGAAGVIPAVLNYFVVHENGSTKQVHEFLLTAAAIGGLIKHRSSISGAEVGCQGEVGSASAMAAAGLCAARGGTPEQVENAAEIALEHHLGMTCDPVAGLVQVPCIERNGFGAIKAYTAASLALRGSGEHFMPLDSCIEAMKQTGLEMSHKYKETSLGGLAVSITEC